MDYYTEYDSSLIISDELGRSGHVQRSKCYICNACGYPAKTSISPVTVYCDNDDCDQPDETDEYT